MNINVFNQNNNELPVNDNVDDMDKQQAEVNDSSKSIRLLSIDENSDSRIVTYGNMHLPSKNEYIEYKLKMTVNEINVNLYHVLERLQESQYFNLRE